MNTFECVVYDQHGIKKVISVTSETREEAKNKLLSSHYAIVSIELLDLKRSFSFFGGSSLSLDELEFLSSQLSLLLKNGLRLDEALELAQKVAVEKKVKFVLSKLLSSVRDGQPLSGALKEEWGFDRLYVNLVKIGESSGSIDSVFEGIAADLKFKKILSGKIKQAISYPVLVFFFCVAAILFVFNVVIPRMSVLFDSQENLPWYTHAMLSVADFVTTYQWFALPFLGGILIAFTQVKHNKILKDFVDKFLIFTPMLSKLARNIDRIRYCSALHLTIKSGISIERAMQYSAEVVKNSILRRQLSASEVKVRQGASLADAFQQTLLFDDIHTGLIEVGERSGDLESIFKEITEREQFNFDALVTRFTALLEPILILIMAGIVGSVVVVMLMSIIAVQDVGF